MSTSDGRLSDVLSSNLFRDIPLYDAITNGIPSRRYTCEFAGREQLGTRSITLSLMNPESTVNLGARMDDLSACITRAKGEGLVKLVRACISWSMEARGADPDEFKQYNLASIQLQQNASVEDPRCDIVFGIKEGGNDFRVPLMTKIAEQKSCYEYLSDDPDFRFPVYRALFEHGEYRGYIDGCHRHLVIDYVAGGADDHGLMRLHWIDVAWTPVK